MIESRHLQVRVKILSVITQVLRDYVKKLRIVVDDSSVDPRTLKYEPVPNAGVIDVRNYLFDPKSVLDTLEPPCFYVITDPEIVAEVSLDGTRLQRFPPIFIQGWISPLLDYTTAELVAAGYPAPTNSAEKLMKESYVSLLGEAYADSIIAALTLKESIIRYDNALGPNCDGFGLERIGPVMVDVYEFVQELTHISVSVQTSTLQHPAN